MTDVQALWFRETKPEEEFFDTESVPHELHNLADDPAYADKLNELRSACQEWIVETNDRNLIPESELLAELWPEGVQPVTSTPVLAKDVNKLTIT